MVKGSEEIYQNSIIKVFNIWDLENFYEMMFVERKYKVRIYRFFKVFFLCGVFVNFYKYYCYFNRVNLVICLIFFQGEELLGGKGKRVKYIYILVLGVVCGFYFNKGKMYILLGKVMIL